MCIDRRSFMSLAGGSLAMLGLGPAVASDIAIDLPSPAHDDKCPVCGMFVAKYPDWVATILFKDGSAFHFDGAKDMFKYLFDLAKYAPGRSLDDIRGIGVSEYYGVEMVDAKSALYVVGSDVFGPMGHELVPLATREDAEEFLDDHKGETIIGFGDVTPDLLKHLDDRGK